MVGAEGVKGTIDRRESVGLSGAGRARSTRPGRARRLSRWRGVKGHTRRDVYHPPTGGAARRWSSPPTAGSPRSSAGA